MDARDEDRQAYNAELREKVDLQEVIAEQEQIE
jgi:hypothetical protein